MAAASDGSLSYGLKETLSHVLEREELPVIVRACEDFVNTTMEGRAVIHSGEELLITERRTVELGRVRVLDVLDEAEARKAHDDDFVAERGMFVGEEYLLPVKIPCKLKFVQRPGKRRRYATVSQVIEDMPRRLRVDQDVMSVPPGGAGQNTLVSRGTVLNIKRVFSCSIDSEQYLQCTFGTKNVSFKGSMRVNFTAVDDASEYTLAYIQKSNIFPSVFEFVSPKQTDVVHFEFDIACSTLTNAEGPLELLAIIQANVLICWKREQKLKSYSTVVIPVSLGNTIHVQQRKFQDPNFRVSYIDKRFSECSGSDFIETGLYMIDPNQMGVAYLKSPALYCYDSGSKRIRSPKNGVRFNVSSDEGNDDEDNDYIVISPPIPDRAPLRENHEQQIPVHVTMAIIESKKSMFQSVHHDLRKFFKKHASKDKTPSSNVTQAKHKDIEHEAVARHRLPPAPPSEQKREDSDSGDEYDYPDMEEITAGMPKPREQLPSQKSRGDGSDDSDSPGDYEIPEAPTEATPRTLSSSSKSDEPPPRPIRRGLSRRAPPPLPIPLSNPQPPTSTDSGRSDDSIYYSSSEIINPLEDNSSVQSPKPEYIKVSKRDMIHILQQEQTEDDFYRLTVIELSHLMYYCNLEHIATICYDQRLDGEFFRDMDLDILKEEPFDSTLFQVTIFRRIRNGWRPVIE